MPSEVLDRFQHSPLSFYDDPEGFEEKLGEDLLGKLRRNKTVWAAAQERRIDLRDILQIGISRFLDAEDDEGTLSGLLASLKSGADQPVRAEDISGWIERFGIGRATPNEVKQGVYRLAVRHGGDFAAQIPRDARTMRLADGLSRAAHGERRGLDIERRLILFGADVLAGASRAAGLSALPDERDLMRLADAGITAAQAAEGYLRGMSAAQMVAVHQSRASQTAGSEAIPACEEAEPCALWETGDSALGRQAVTGCGDAGVAWPEGQTKEPLG
ncbi:hypothetical protein ASG92_24775 [Arthrobacter sp. Soil736]|nr:hypothetical protein ASG92_24775 [Arthrobacter sp. Soil736]